MTTHKIMAAAAMFFVTTGTQAGSAIDEAKLGSPECKKVRADFIAQAKKIVDLEYGLQTLNTKESLKAAQEEQKRLGKGLEFNCGGNISSITRHELKSLSSK